MKYYEIDVSNITMYPYGGMIKSNMLINTNSRNVLLISLGGVISQLLLWVVVYLFYKVGVVSGFYYNIFFKYNISLIIFNLIPVYPLDGFKILNSLLEMFMSFKYSIIVSFVINFISLIIFFCYMYINSVSNYVIVLFMLFSLIKYIKEIRYVLNKFYIERCIYDIKYNGLKSVSCISEMYKNYFNYINGVGEKEYLENKYGVFL